MPFDPLDKQAAELERMLPGLMRRLFRLEPEHPLSDLPIAQLRVCILLQFGPQSMSAISEEFQISVSAVTQLADRLERAGLVERVSGSDDRRCKMLQLTPYGANVMQTRAQWRVQRVASVLSQLEPAERDALIEAIQILFDASADGTQESLMESILAVRH